MFRAPAIPWVYTIELRLAGLPLLSVIGEVIRYICSSPISLPEGSIKAESASILLSIAFKYSHLPKSLTEAPLSPFAVNFIWRIHAFWETN